MSDMPLVLSTKSKGALVSAGLWQIRAQLVTGTKKVKNDDHPFNGYSSYIISRPEYALLYTKEWIDALDMGALFDIPESAFIDTKERIAKKWWQVEKDLRNKL